MNQIQRKSPFWSVAGPLLGYLAIQSAVQFMIQLVIETPYIIRAYRDILRSSRGTVPSMWEIRDSYEKALEPAFELITAHRVEILAAAALSTIILTGILFVAGCLGDNWFSNRGSVQRFLKKRRSQNTGQLSCSGSPGASRPHV